MIAYDIFVVVIYLFSSLYLLLWGFVSIHGRVSKAGFGEKPLMYASITFQLILNVFFILFLVSTVIFFIVNWKLALLLFVIGMVFGRLVFDPLVERLFLFPLGEYLLKKGEELDNKDKDK